MALGLSSPIKAEALQYQDFANLVSACIYETSYDLEKRGAVARLHSEISLRPLAPHEEQKFSALSLHAALTNPFASPENLPAEALKRFFSDSDLSKRWHDRIRERNRAELSGIDQSSLLSKYAMLDQERRKRSFWWFDNDQKIPIEFSLSSLSRDFFAVCTVANIPESWATALLSHEELSFDASRAESYEHFTAKVDTFPSLLTSLFHSATGREQKHDMLRAEIHLMQFPDFLPEGSSSSPWVLTVKTTPTL